MTLSAAATAEVGRHEAPWRRLDPRMLVVGPAGQLVRLLPLLLIVVVTGQGDTPRLLIAAGITALVVIGGVVRWRTTRYRITPERVELHSGLVRRQHRSVPRDRIRTVDLTSPLLHRVFRLSVVTVHAADSASAAERNGLGLDAVSAAEGERLRQELLERSPAAPVPDEPAAAEPELLAGMNWAWLRFAPLTFSSLAGVGAVLAAGFNLLSELRVDPRDVPGVDDAAERLADGPVWVAVGAVGVLLLVLAVVGSTALFIERWWGYRLTREPDGTLRVHRGLLTRRSLSVSEQRLRGVEVTEPLLLRAGRGARTTALSTGLGKESQGGALQPPTPRAEAHRIGAAALTPTFSKATFLPDSYMNVALLKSPPSLTPLTRHPRVALRRRMTRALGSTAVLVAVAWVLAETTGPGWIGPFSLALLPPAALLGWDRYRGLGHALTPHYLVSRLGGLNRRTVVLQRQGVIGWTVRQSPFQRQVGVVTLEAVTAAGDGGYRILDIGDADAVALADAVTPEVRAFAARER
ncbi:MAG: PH domain-containing protein [Pseudonocardia sp.]|nr:PH domain-containing protein [Pseudonocardia sp.]